MSEEKISQILRKINIGWWGCVGTIVIYLFVTLFFKTLPYEKGLKVFDEVTKTSLIFSLITISIISIIIPFTILGRKRIQNNFDPEKIMKFAFLRLAFMEIPIILGTMFFTFNQSYNIYIIFLSISLVGLIFIKGENNYYFEILESPNVKL